jgi:esterase/lipase
MKVSTKLSMLLALLFAWVSLPVAGMADTSKIGIVIMHGKGGSPSKHVGGLAKLLTKQGYLVANIEMPWSKNREYDVDVTAAEAEVESALDKLRQQGAQKVFVSGHSQGGAFALHFAGSHTVDGVICISPGGSVGSKVFREELGESVARARGLIAEGNGAKKAKLKDYEGKKGLFNVNTTPDVYLSWFDPDGAMNTQRAAREVNPQTPILWLVAQRDYPGLRKINIPMFELLQKNSRSLMFEPDSDHLGSPDASYDEMVRWISEVVSAER